MKVVINKCYGGFGLSTEARVRYQELSGTTVDDDYALYDLNRDDPFLIQTVEELGDAADGIHAELKIVEIPDDVKWEIHDYDGIETIHEVHRVWS